MTIRIENASGSLAYLRIKHVMDDEPPEVRDGIKVYASGIDIMVSTMPMHPVAHADDYALASGQSLDLDVPCEFTDIEFMTGDKDADLFAYEETDLGDPDCHGYRLVASGLTRQVPDDQLH